MGMGSKTSINSRNGRTGMNVAKIRMFCGEVCITVLKEAVGVMRRRV